jgi:hypothetical protein
MGNRVGKIHKHDLPYNGDLPVLEDVYACYCGEEFMVQAKTETRFGKDNKEWVKVPGDISIQYEKTVNGETFIGRAGPDTVFDEVNNEGGETGASGEEVAPSSDGTSGTGTSE